MLYGIHMRNRYGFGKPRSNPRKIKIAIQQTVADLIMKERSSGPLVLLMLKYVPTIPPARPNRTFAIRAELMTQVVENQQNRFKSLSPNRPFRLCLRP